MLRLVEYTHPNVFLCIICTTCIFDKNLIFSFDQHNMEHYLAPAGNDIEVQGSAKGWVGVGGRGAVVSCPSK